MVLTLHSLALAVSSYALFQLAYSLTTSRHLAVITCLFFLFNGFTQSAILYLHFEVFAMAFLLLYLWQAREGRLISSLVFLDLGLVVKQDVWVYALGLTLSFYGLVSKRVWFYSLGIILGYFVIILGLLYPYLYPKATDRFLDYWSQGTTKSEVIVYFLKSIPDVVTKAFCCKGEIFNKSFWYIPFLSGLRIFPALGVFVLLRSSTNPSVSGLYLHYTVGLLALYLACMPLGLKRIIDLLEWIRLKLNASNRTKEFFAPGMMMISFIILAVNYNFSPFFLGSHLEQMQSMI